MWGRKSLTLHDVIYETFLNPVLGFAAAARSEWKWESGKEYVYGYSGRLLTGMPELDANHFSGLVSFSTHKIEQFSKF